MNDAEIPFRIDDPNNRLFASNYEVNEGGFICWPALGITADRIIQLRVSTENGVAKVSIVIERQP